MIHRLCSAAVLIALAGCGSSGGDDPVVPPVSIRPLTFDAPSTEASAGNPSANEPAGSSPEASSQAADDGVADPVGETTSPARPGTDSPSLAADGTPLSSEVDARLRGVFEIANGDGIEFAVAVSRRLVDVEVGPREGFIKSRDGVDAGNGVTDTTLLCPEGGTLDTTSLTLYSSEGRYTLHQCDVGPMVLDGVIEGRVRGSEREIRGEIPVEPNYVFDGFSIHDQRDGRRLVISSGKVTPSSAGTTPATRFGYGAIGTYGSDKTVGAGSMFDERADRSVAALGTMRTLTHSNPTVDAPLGGMMTSFDVRFGAEPARVEVDTVVPFDGLDPQGRFARGSLTVTAEGYVYTLDADDGDPATFRLDVAEDGVTTSYVMPWSTVFGFDAFEPEGIDVGF